MTNIIAQRLDLLKALLLYTASNPAQQMGLYDTLGPEFDSTNLLSEIESRQKDVE
jgi:hypothetical protein